MSGNVQHDRKPASGYGRVDGAAREAPLLLNLGCGPRAVQGWENLDRSPNILIQRVPGLKALLGRAGLLNAQQMVAWDSSVRHVDIRHLRIRTSTVDGIYSSHTLEHLYLSDVERVLRECHRVLRRGSILRLALPDAEVMARQFVTAVAAGDQAAGEQYNTSLLAHPRQRPSGINAVKHRMAGHVHRWQPSPSMVTTLLAAAGFTDITRHLFHEGALPLLGDVETRENSFFLEAVK